MISTRRARWQIHVCVVLWGFTAVLGKLISLQALPLVWWRMTLMTCASLLWPRVWRGLRTLSPSLLLKYSGIGVIVALHWLTFYGAVKLANASIAATCIALAPVFLAIVEPWIAGRRFDPYELLLGVFVLPGVALVVGATPAGMRSGIAVGVVSAGLVALFSALNKRMIEQADAAVVTSVEVGAGALFLALIMVALPDREQLFVLPGARDLALLLVLAVGCTLLPFNLALGALRRLSAFSAQLAINLEPAYAIAFAAVLLNEQKQLDYKFYLGVAIILAAVFAHPWLAARNNPRQSIGPTLLG